MKLRKWTAEEKMAIVLEGLKGQKSVAGNIRSVKRFSTAGEIVFWSLDKKD